MIPYGEERDAASRPPAIPADRESAIEAALRVLLADPDYMNGGVLGGDTLGDMVAAVIAVERAEARKANR